MARSASIRASDADRDAVAERLRRAAVEGRIDADELDERLHVALRARTYGELQRLLGDLPREASRRSPVMTALLVGAAALGVLMVAAVVVALIVFAAASWLVWVLVWFAVCGHRRCVPRRRHSRLIFR